MGQLLVVLLVVALMIDLGLTFSDRTFTADWRAGRLARAALVGLVLIPLVTATIVRIVAVSRPAEVALVVLSVAPAAPVIPNAVRRAGGSVSYAVAALFFYAVVTVASAPPSARLLLGYEGEVSLPAGLLIARLAAVQIIPFLTGLVVARHARATVAAVLQRAARVAFIAALIAVMAVVIAPRIESVVVLSARDLLATLFATAAAWGVAWLLAGRAPADRRTLALLSGAPNIGLGLAIITGAGAPSQFAAAMVAVWILRIAANVLLALFWTARGRQLT